MPVTVRQHAFSPEVDNDRKSPTARSLWYARGSDSESEVITAAEATIPSTLANLVLKGINYKNQGGNFWDIQAVYELPDYIDGGGGLGDPAQPNTPPAGLATPIDGATQVGPEFSADTTGGTQHITQSIITQVSKKIGDADGGPFTAPDYKQAIGVSKDGIAGTDIFVGKLEFTVTLKVTFITWDYILLCSELTGTVNDAAFLIFEQGEVLFLGITPNYQTGEGWTITFKFAISRNVEEIELSDELTLKAMDRGGDWVKLGWEYLWVEYQEVDDGNGNLIHKPRSAYIEQVYEMTNLTQLGFGAPA